MEDHELHINLLIQYVHGKTTCNFDDKQIRILKRITWELVLEDFFHTFAYKNILEMSSGFRLGTVIVFMYIYIYMYG